jgi:peptide deformylase
MILPIARMGAPVLEQRANEVQDVSDPAIQTLIENMIETFIETGVGLAAPQVSVPVRIVVFHLYPEWGKLRGMPEGIPLTVLINPIIEPLTEELQVGWEGCMSIPGMMGEVARPRAIRYSGLNQHGEKIVEEIEGYHARIVQHECDHLDGILYPQRMLDMRRFGFVDEIKQARAHA